MLRIRLFRVGKKNQPSYKIVVTDKRKPPRAGRFVEQVGIWNPLIKEKTLKTERIKYWLSVGAQPSDTVYNLLVSEKIIKGKKIDVHKKPKKKEKTEKKLTEKVEEKPIKEKIETEPKEVKPIEKVSQKEESEDKGENNIKERVVEEKPVEKKIEDGTKNKPVEEKNAKRVDPVK